jgi:hypothetical protein
LREDDDAIVVDFEERRENDEDAEFRACGGRDCVKVVISEGSDYL